jgi:serpin B
MKSYPILALIAAMVILAAAIVVISLNRGFDVDVKQDEVDNDSTFALGNISIFGNAVNVFSFDLFKELYAENEANIFLSPYSVFVALAMVYEGAVNETADEMAKVLRVKQDNQSFHDYMKNLYDNLNKNNEYNISTANSLWIKENLQLLQYYLDVIQTYYGGNATEVDFSNPSQTANKINQWVENNTNGLIKDLIQSDYIDPFYTALILTNAIYFKALWKVQFDPENTTERDFESCLGNVVNVPTMTLVNTKDVFNYTETSDLQILELPYTRDEISMMILLPKNKDLDDIIDAIDNDDYAEWRESLAETEVDIYLPKFEMKTSYDLKNILIQMGLVNAFSSSADFSGITGGKDLFVSNVFHKAFIEVNEQGTEAAAATAVIMELTVNGGGSSRVIFDANHPFLFLIQHKETGTILFMGKICNPTE